MAVHWTDKREGTALVGAELRRRGWTLFGWTDDKSDPMTDYYAPESWDGIATHPERPGVVVCVNVSPYTVKSCSGGCPMTRRVAGEVCPRCNGAQADPDGWTLEKARQDPRAWHASVNAGTGAVSLMPGVVSPIPFIGSGWGGGHGETYDYPPELRGRERCRRCSGAGHLLKTEHYLEPWPTFQANPRGATWHVERGGVVVASGTGVYSVADCNDRPNQAAKVGALCDRIERAAAATAVKVAELAGVGLDARPEGVVVRASSLGRAGVVEVVFPAKPVEEVRAALKAAGFRWAKSGGCWYGPEAALPAELRRVEA